MQGSVPAETMLDFVPLFKALCYSTRAQIVELLLRRERCVCDLTGPLDQSQPLVSHHLALLRDAGLVQTRSEGARTYYTLESERVESDLRRLLTHVQRLRSESPAQSAAGGACAVTGSAKRPDTN